MSASTRDAPRVDRDRLLADLDRFAAVGATIGGGVTRLALSDEDRVARDLLRERMEEARLTVRVDDLGNMTGRRQGGEAGSSVLLGSHLDTVRQGGRFDGVLGVLGALEVVRALNDAGIATRRPLEVVNWTNEEGVRFEPAMTASGVVAGRFDAAYVYSRTDREGRIFEDELRRIGYLEERENRPGPAAAYLELHVEQGPVLEAEGCPVGIVEGIVGITWTEVRWDGQADHAGPSPMSLRKDALVAAAQLVGAVERVARETDPIAVGTVGRLQVEPNSINTIPGRVVMSVDLRHPNPAALEAMFMGVERDAMRIADERGIGVELERFWTSDPTPFAPEVVGAVAGAVRALGLPERRLWSGAGHDAKYLADVCPAGMIFVRSRNGLSHCEQEYSAPEDVVAGANVLLGTALALAGIG
jgi:N-carbamoyl-L-amino-acid hydrolase